MLHTAEEKHPKPPCSCFFLRPTSSCRDLFWGISCANSFPPRSAAQSFSGIPFTTDSPRGHIMGVGSSVDLAVPPGGSTLVLMNPTECIQTKPKINSTQKPLCLSMLGDAQWNEWMGKLQQYVNQYLNELLPFFFVPFAFLVVLGAFIASSAGVDIPPFTIFPIVLLVFLTVFVSRFLIVTKNQGRAKKLKGGHIMCVLQEISYIIHLPNFFFKTMLE